MGVGELTKVTGVVEPPDPTKLNRTLKIVVPAGTVIPVTLLSFQEKVNLPEPTCEVPKLEPERNGKL
jgi:hypothetical protein